MENQFENTPDRIPTKEEVLEAITRFAGETAFVRELTDEQGLYLLEAKVESKKPDEYTIYMYMRKGNFPNQNATSETSIHAVYYENETPVGGDVIAVYKSETGIWEEVK